MGVRDEREELVLGQRDGQGLVRELVGEMYGRCRGDLGETWGIFWGHVGRSREMYISRLYFPYISPISRLLDLEANVFEQVVHVGHHLIRVEAIGLGLGLGLG